MRMEILAPAGGPESLIAASRCGADAVYLGGRFFNARRGAENFDGIQLCEAVSYCHVRGIKVYLALNTLVYDNELSHLKDALIEACAAGVDAVIVQDFAAARMVRRCAPTLPLHASTQMCVHDAYGAKMLEELGFSRVVLARELSREEIVKIRCQTTLELECFVHGALCMCVSGQCYLSSMIGGRSGNRGMCAQPCRLPFTSDSSRYALSLRDLSLIPDIQQLAALGVTGLKIEGRMKRPEYVAAAVTACRTALEGGEPDYAVLEAAFSREGFTDGYYKGTRGRKMFGIRSKDNVVAMTSVMRGLSSLYRTERQSVEVNFSLHILRGQKSTLQVTDSDGNTAEISGPVPEQAITAPTTKERAVNALQKTGGTPYKVVNVDTEIEQGLILAASTLNTLRRDVLEQLTSLRASVKLHTFTDVKNKVCVSYTAAQHSNIRVRVSRAEQLTEGIAANADEIVITALEFSKICYAMLKQYKDKLMIEIPGILFEGQKQIKEQLQKAKDAGITHAFVGGLGGIYLARMFGFTIHGDYGLNITNTSALEEYSCMGLHDVTLSIELELSSIQKMGGSIRRGILAYGYLPLMVTRNCPAGQCRSCNRSHPHVTDRLGNRFFVDCDWGVPRMFNHLPLYLADKLGGVQGVDFISLYFTKETPEECERIFELYQNGGVYEGEKTRGLYFRKVL